mgnify:CR=1 FL=1
MKLKRRIKLNERIAIPVLFVILIILLIIYGNIIFKNISYGKFAKQNMEVYENNKEQVFKVEKILICSSANATDLSEKQNLQDMSIYQYTDIAVYINNGEDLSNKNTVKELYIDNISLEGNSDIGKKELNYKNILKFGLKKDTLPKSSTITDMSSEHNVFESLMNNTGNNNTASNDNKSIDVGNIVTNETEESTSEVQENSEYEDDGKIKFNIVYTNEENEKADYNKPTFYTDCSNPITLEYLNNDIATNYKIDENKSVSFDGSILKDAGISTESLACKVKFKINIINNEDEKYSCWINFDIPLDDSYEGTTMKAKSTNNQKYVFFRE